MKNNLRNGLSGILRVKNEQEFVEACIDSCIEALDELIIVYNDCTDSTPKIIERKRSEYPTKIKVYPYEYEIYGTNLSKEKFEKTLALPDDSPHLLCNYYNFALSKASYQFAMKIDADQIYCTEELQRWADLCRHPKQCRWSFKCIGGAIFYYMFLLYRYICLVKCKKSLPFLPIRIISCLKEYYIAYGKYLFGKGKACFSLSGLNVFRNRNRWYVTLGRMDEALNVAPPYNGEGDHLIFRVSSDTYYKRFVFDYYNILKTDRYSIIEEFVHPYKVFFVGFVWFHMSQMRLNCRAQMQNAQQEHPEAFAEISKFYSLSFKQIDKYVDKSMTTIYQRVLFRFIHNAFINKVQAIIPLLSLVNLNQDSSNDKH